MTTMTTPTLQEAITQHSLGLKFGAKREDLVKTVITNLNDLLRKFPYSQIGKAEIEKEINALVTQYLRFHITEKYPLLDPEIFELDRTISLGELKPYIGSGNYGHLAKSLPDNDTIEIPLFQLHELGKKNVYNGEFDDLTVRKGATTTFEWTIELECPQIPPSVKSHIYEARAFVSEIQAKAFREPAIADYMEWKNCTGINAEFGVLWKPSPENFKITVKDKDPALLMKVRDDQYVITTWDIPGEEPFRNYLREFVKYGKTPLFDRIEDKPK